MGRRKEGRKRKRKEGRKEMRAGIKYKWEILTLGKLRFLVQFFNFLKSEIMSK